MATSKVRKRKRDEKAISKHSNRTSRGGRAASQDLFVSPEESDTDHSLASLDNAGLSDDDEEISEFSGNDETYDPKYETLPDHVAYHEVLGNIKSVARFELKQYENIWGNCEEPPCKEMQKLVDRFLAAQKFTEPEALVIGLWGAAGTGKSSLINSVLDCGNLATTGATGSSCTNVVTEFCAAPQNQEQKYVATIIYLDMKQIKRLLSQHLDDVLDLIRLDYDEDCKSLTRQERREIEKKASTAFTSFSTIFAEQEEYSDPAKAEIALREISDDSKPNFLERFLGWCASLIGSNATRRISANKPEEMNELLKYYTSPNASSAKGKQLVSFWPLVSKVTITLKDWHVLNGLRHITFVDLPGTHDQNLVRVETTNAYLAQCDAIWVVCQIARVKDNDDVDKMLNDAIAMVKSKAALVITNSDANLDERLLETPGIAMLDTRQCRKNWSILRKQRNEFKVLSRRIQASFDKTERKNLKRQRKRLENSIPRAKANFEVELMLLRNIDVTKDMQAAFRAKVQRGRSMKVLCVSNELYRRARYDQGEACDLDARLTNIPALRSYALELPAPRIYCELRDYIRGPYRDYLEGVSSWTEASPVLDATVIATEIRNTAKSAIESIQNFENSVDQLIEGIVFKKLHENAPEYSKTACMVAKRWETLGWATYRNRCKCRGLISSPKQTRLSWNEELTENITKKLEDSWALLAQKQAMEAGVIKGTLQAHVRTIFARIKENTTGDSNSLKAETEIQKIFNALETNVTNFNKLISDIRVHMSLDVSGSMVVNLLYSTYERCGAEHGKGMKKRMLASMHAALNKPGENSFANRLRRMAREDYYKGRKATEGQLATGIGSIFEKLAENVELMGAQKIIYIKEIEELRQLLAVRIAKAMHHFDGMISDLNQLDASASALND